MIWDNLSPHKAAEALRAVHQVGAEVISLPTASPDLSPIEEMFSKAKGEVKSAAARATGALAEAIGSALGDITPQDAVGWFNSRAAYAMQS